MGRARDDRDAAQDLARDLADMAHQISSLKGEANAYLSDQKYDTLQLRLEVAHAAVEARSTQPTRGYLGGSRMTTGIFRSVRF
jgi:hypothetical protein